MIENKIALILLGSLIIAIIIKPAIFMAGILAMLMALPVIVISWAALIYLHGRIRCLEKKK